jgi:hypothetical protein
MDGRSPVAFTFSREAARILGPLIIVIETLRRRGQFGDVHHWPAIADDYIAGAFLFFAATIARRDPESRGPVYLGAAWGVGAGMMYGSFFSQLQRSGEADPSGLPVLPILIVKGIGLVLCLLGLVGALKGRRGGGVTRVGPTS